MLKNEMAFDVKLTLDLHNDTSTFGEYLRTVRTEKLTGKVSIRELAKRVKKTPTYISDIEKGNNKPPNEELLSNIIIALELGDNADVIRNNLFDLAAKERGVVPADIARFIMEDSEVRTAIRLAKVDNAKRQQILQILK